MKTIAKRIWYSTVGVIFAITGLTIALLIMIWVNKDADREPWAFWEKLG